MRNRTKNHENEELKKKINQMEQPKKEDPNLTKPQNVSYTYKQRLIDQLEIEKHHDE